MPKRPNPFGESSPLQYKTHVGKKELDMGINMEQNMQTVYDRTKSLLFEGSKRSTAGCSSCGTSQQWSLMEPREEHMLQPLPGQMRLDPEGRICPKIDPLPEAALSSAPQLESPALSGQEPMSMDGVAPIYGSGDHLPPKSPNKQLQIDARGRLYYTGEAGKDGRQLCTQGFGICHSCNHPTHLGTRKCNFCEKATCSSCLNQCYSCQGVICPVCSIMNYDDCVERSFCLQCV